MRVVIDLFFKTGFLSLAVLENNTQQVLCTRMKAQQGGMASASQVCPCNGASLTLTKPGRVQACSLNSFSTKNLRQEEPREEGYATTWARLGESVLVTKGLSRGKSIPEHEVFCSLAHAICKLGVQSSLTICEGQSSSFA